MMASNKTAMILDACLVFIGYYLIPHLLSAVFNAFFFSDFHMDRNKYIAAAFSFLFLAATVFLAFLSGYKRRPGIMWGFVSVGIFAIVAGIFFATFQNLIGLILVLAPMTVLSIYASLVELIMTFPEYPSFGNIVGILGIPLLLHCLCIVGAYWGGKKLYTNASLSDQS